MMDFERRLAALERRVESLVCVGRISRPDPGTGRATVVIEAPGGDVTTHDLPVLYPRTLTERDQWTHRAGEHVLCILLPTGNEAGFVVGAYYAGQTPPVSDATARVIHGQNLDIRGTDRVVVGSPDVRLGSATASAGFVLGPALIEWLNLHTHPTAATGAPSVPTVPAPATLLSTTIRGE